jgi:hypothetical protein
MPRHCPRNVKIILHGQIDSSVPLGGRVDILTVRCGREPWCMLNGHCSSVEHQRQTGSRVNDRLSCVTSEVGRFASRGRHGRGSARSACSACSASVQMLYTIVRSVAGVILALFPCLGVTGAPLASWPGVGLRRFVGETVFLGEGRNGSSAWVRFFLLVSHLDRVPKR